MPKRLNQLIAIEKTRKSELEATFTKIYHWFQRSGPFDGFTKRYEPDIEGGASYPSEATNVQISVPVLKEQLEEALNNLFDLVASKDATNGVARADVVVDGETILHDVPGTTLIFLDKQLTDLRTVFSKMPVLDAALEWNWDSQNGLWRTDEQWSVRQEKTREPLVLYPATDKHPAQVKEIEVVRNVGKWYTKKFSGAIPLSERSRLLARVDELRVAVKLALEEANLVTTVELPVGKRIFDFLYERT